MLKVMEKVTTNRSNYGKSFYVKVLVLAGLQFLVVVDGTVMALAIPAIRGGLDLSSSGKNWVISSYIIFFGGFMLLGGRLGDVFGRKKVFLIGVAIFTLMSALCGVALNEVSLVIFRALQGLGAAIAAPTAMALVTTSFPAGKMRNRAFAIYGGVSGVGSIAGLILGGFLVSVNWRLIFLINVPVGILVLIGGFITLDEVQGSKQKLDIPGAVLVTLSSISIIYTFQQAVYGFWRPQTCIPLILFFVLFYAFIYVERKGVENPIIPLKIFENKNRVMALLSIFMCGGILTSLAYLIADFLQKVLGYTALKSGVAVIPFAIGLVIAASISSILAEYIETRWSVILGVLLVATVCLFSSKAVSPTISYYPKMMFAIFIVGFGVGLIVIALSLSVVAGVGSSEVGPLTAFANVAQDLGGIVALIGINQITNSFLLKKGFDIDTESSVFSPADINLLSQGSSISFMCCAILALAILIPAFCMRFSVEDIAEGKKAKEMSNEG